MALTPEEQAELDALRAKSGNTTTTGRRTRPEPTPATNFKNIGRSIFQGATLGFGDEAIAGIRSALGEDYDTALEDERGQIAAFNRENPVGSFLTEGLGGFALTGPVGAARAGLSRVAPQAIERGLGRVASQFERLPVPAQTAVIGGLTGGAAGFGQGEGDFGERAANAVPSALGGFTLGGALPLVLGAGRGAYNAAVTPPRAKAEKMILGDMADDSLDVSQLGFQLRGDQQLGVPATIATQGTNLTSLGEGVANLPGAGMNLARREIERAHRGQGERVSNALHARTGAGDYLKKAEDIDNVLKQQATPVYEKAYAAPVNMMDRDVADVLQLIPKDELAKAANAAKKVYTSDPLNVGKPPREFFKFKYEGDDPTKGNIIGVDFPIDMNTAEWHAFIRGLREVKDGLWRNGAAHASNFTDAYKKLDRIGKQKNPLFADAQKIYSDARSVQEAMDDGEKAMLSYMTPDKMKKQMAGLSQNEQEHYRAGALKALDDKLARQSDGANKAAALVNTGHIRNKLRAITPDANEYEALIATLETEARNAAARSKMTLGSPTASRAEAIRGVREQDEFVPQVFDAIKSPTQFASAWLAAKAKGFGIGKKTGDEAASMLFATDPKEQAEILQRLRARQAALAKETEEANVGYKLGAQAFGSAAGSPTMERQRTLPEETE
jgi:hypothetical protein